jgi:hypothetical protein
MKCKKAWSNDFMADAFGKNFVKTKLKTMRENLLFEREKGLMPATQAYVEWLIMDRELAEKLKALEAELSEIKRNLMSVSSKDKLKMAILVRIYDIKLKRDYLVVAVERRVFVRQCPSSECKGFLSTKWMCGICGLKACPTCHEIKGLDEAQHECKPENVETAKLIAKESKPCPNCSIPICKISGCSQMFCTSCHTGWDWNTGMVVKGRIHNPHYYEMMRDNGQEMREHQDVPCGGFMEPFTFHRKIMAIVGPVWVSTFNGKLQGLIHMWDVLAATFRQNLITDNLKLRAQYMMNEIDEAKFKTMIQQRDKAARKKNEYYAILCTLRDVSLDVFNAMMEAKTKDELTKLDADLVKMWVEADKSLGMVAFKYNCKKPELQVSMMVQAIVE